MNHLILPVDLKKSLQPTDWQAAKKSSLNGYFYDHICDSNGQILGVRYWIGNEVLFDKHEVFSQFKNDARFKFNQRSCYVDIVWDVKSIDALADGKLTIETVQDFGGDGVVQYENLFGISFTL
jgi:hypothetical protein